MGLDFRTCLCLGQSRPGGSARAAGAAGQGRLLLPPEQHLSPGPKGPCLAPRPADCSHPFLGWGEVVLFPLVLFISLKLKLVILFFLLDSIK